MRMECSVLCGIAMTACTLGAQAQAPTPPITTQPNVVNQEMLSQEGKALLEQARSGRGSAGKILSEYKNHYTMLTARTKSGGAELHGHFADFLVVVDGEGMELTGGTIVDRKDAPNGDAAGSRLEGATEHTLKKGDIIHIPAGTPHQSIEGPGQSIIIYVIKVDESGGTAAK
jgi:mannose-6-phosphate isomerase-like protein (cupin superfamily)